MNKFKFAFSVKNLKTNTLMILTNAYKNKKCLVSNLIIAIVVIYTMFGLITKQNKIVVNELKVTTNFFTGEKVMNILTFFNNLFLC